MSLISLLGEYHHLSVIPRCGYSSFWQAFSVQLSKCLRGGIFSCFQCLYGRCLLLSHSSHLVVLLPSPIMLSVVPLSSQCGLWYSVHCRIARCRIPLFVLWSYLDHRLFGLFHVHLLPVFFWNMEFMILYFLDVAHLPKCRLFRFSVRAQICPFHRVYSFPYLNIEVFHHYIYRVLVFQIATDIGCISAISGLYLSYVAPISVRCWQFLLNGSYAADIGPR